MSRGISPDGLDGGYHQQLAESLTWNAGEIVGLAGLVGAGRTEVLLTLFGVTPALGGTVRVSGNEILPRSPLEAIHAGLALVPEDRKKQGVILEMAVRENVSLASLRRDQMNGFLNRRREAGLGRRNETVRLTYPDRFWIEYEFSATEGSPAKALYERKHRKPDSEEFETLSEEDRPLKPITIDGIWTPFVIDHFRAGIQTSRINYDKVEYNLQLADSLFAKPASLKVIK